MSAEKLATLDDWSDSDDEMMALVVQAEALQITDTPSYEAAVHFRTGVKRLIEEIQAEYKPQKQAMDAAKRVILDKEQARLKQPQFALSTVNKALETYETAQRREKVLAEANAAREAKETGAVVPAKAVEVPRVAGFAFSTHYKGTVTDKKALMRAVLEGKVSEDVFAVVQSVLDDWARTAGPSTTTSITPGQVQPMPGVPGCGIVAERRARG